MVGLGGVKSNLYLYLYNSLVKLTFLLVELELAQRVPNSPYNCNFLKLAYESKDFCLFFNTESWREPYVTNLLDTPVVEPFLFNQSITDKIIYIYYSFNFKLCNKQQNCRTDVKTSIKRHLYITMPAIEDFNNHVIT